MVKPEDNAETLSNRPNQTLVSTQTVTHEYLTLSGKVARETVKKNGSVTDVMDFVYDESGRPFALNHSTNGGSSFTTYYYILNLQGDVVKLVTASGSAVATYEYDAWGKVLSATGSMANKNPLRYRGYYYDSETGFYYLQSRYYDPANRRFINADIYSSTGQGFVGMNMFAYCLNNPVNCIDSEGTISIWVFLFINSEFGWIHRKVQEHIRMQGRGNYEIERGVYDSSGGYIGRVDVYNIHTGEAWEVKSVATQVTAYPQLERYLGNKLKSGMTLTAGGAGRFSGEFVVNYLDYSYLVSYVTPSTGVVTYSVKEISYQEKCDYEYLPASLATEEKKQSENSIVDHGLAPHGVPSPLIAMVVVGGGALICGKILGGSLSSFTRQTAYSY